VYGDYEFQGYLCLSIVFVYMCFCVDEYVLGILDFVFLGLKVALSFCSEMKAGVLGEKVR
jgi:hypothetical protein